MSINPFAHMTYRELQGLLGNVHIEIDSSRMTDTEYLREKLTQELYPVNKVECNMERVVEIIEEAWQLRANNTGKFLEVIRLMESEVKKMCEPDAYVHTDIEPESDFKIAICQRLQDLKNLVIRQKNEQTCSIMVIGHSKTGKNSL